MPEGNTIKFVADIFCSTKRASITCDIIDISHAKRTVQNVRDVRLEGQDEFPLNDLRYWTDDDGTAHHHFDFPTGGVNCKIEELPDPSEHIISCYRGLNI